MSNDKVQSIMALVDDYSDASHDYAQACALDLTGEMKKASARCRELEDKLRAAIREAIAAPGVAQDEGNERFDATVDSVRDWLRTEQGVYLSLPSTRKLVLLALAAAPSPTAEQPVTIKGGNE